MVAKGQWLTLYYTGLQPINSARNFSATNSVVMENAGEIYDKTKGSSRK